ncbi:hypothetical protein CPB83DRAFT_210915 [Crepidotus variabilis]|uniref:Uncharacterized protein n=1 Tax=Crepidotus variabilis TaxID=179855 RepID=A0A9P6ET70_9AGAR|nr:hypothetical protein CPB83DRAFT_210915 [Crepidotus variabilis]
MRKSRNFLDRFQMRALIEELIKTDPKKTPIQDRNIDWLVARYLQEIHPRGKNSGSRILFLDDDPSFDREMAGEPRRLNHLPHSRIRGQFAAQAEWLLAHMLASSSQSVKMLDITQWVRFCQQSRLDSIAAFLALQKRNRSQSRRDDHEFHWGVPHGQEPPRPSDPYNLCKNLARYGQKEEFWRRALKNATAPKIEKVRTYLALSMSFPLIFCTFSSGAETRSTHLSNFKAPWGSSKVTSTEAVSI